LQILASRLNVYSQTLDGADARPRRVGPELCRIVQIPDVMTVLLNSLPSPETHTTVVRLPRHHVEAVDVTPTDGIGQRPRRAPRR
jgi:hypothetical protein